MSNKRNPSVSVAIRAILLFAKDVDRIFTFLRDFSCYPYIDEDAVEALDEFGVIEVYQ